MRWLAKMTRIRIGTFSTIGTPFFFRLSNAKMMLRLIFIIGCVWNSTPKYTPNYWDSKRHLETFSFTLYCNLHLIISCLQFYDILWKYKFESLSLRQETLNDSELHRNVRLQGRTFFFFRLSNAKMMLRLIFIIGCVWNSTPKYTPNNWDSKRHLERFSFTLYLD